MPYYHFVGINLSGSLVRSKRFARNIEQLDAVLLRDDIALLRARQQSSWFTAKISLKHKVQFFSYMATMLAAGIRMSDALTIVALSLPEPLRSIAHDIHNAIQEGSPLHKALACHHELASPHLIALLAAGEDSGQIMHSFEHIARYEESLHEVAGKIRRALMMPLISGTFFIFMMILCVVVIIPRFQQLFVTLGKPLPWSTKTIFAINDWFQSVNFLWCIVVFLIATILIRFLYRYEQYKYFYDRTMLTTPCIGAILKHRDIMLFLQTLAVLLSGGVHLAKALGPATMAISNRAMRHYCNIIEQEVVAGKLLSELLSHIPGVQGKELCGLVAIGEASGTLPRMIQQAALLYQERLYYSLELITTTIQPVLLVLMGILVALLIMVIYTPLLSLSHALF